MEWVRYACGAHRYVMTKGLTRKITKKKALSYSRTVPNGIGVTAIASVNGRGAYAKRYAATKSVLKKNSAGTLPVHGKTGSSEGSKGSAGGKAMTFEEWSKSMKKAKANKRRSASKRSTKLRAAVKHAAKKAVKRVRRRARKNPSTITQAAANRRKRARKATPNKRRKARKNPLITQAAANKRRKRARKATPNRKHRAKRNPALITQAAANRRKHHRKAKKAHANRRRVHRNPLITQAAANRRRHHRKHKVHANRRHYRKNAGGGALVAELKSVLMVGVVAGAGFLAHRALSKVVSDKLLASSTMSYKNALSAVLVAAVGVPAAVKFLPKQSQALGAGMIASALQTVIVSVLGGDSKIVGYLSGYPDAAGRAYTNFGPGISGTGEYYEVPQGTGEYYEVPQGVGEYFEVPQGVGEYYEVPQGVGGFGATPLLSEAAAGTGAYNAHSVSGIGDYEAVAAYGELGASKMTDEGIMPNLNEAERALTVAEAAAGIGDLPMRSIVEPTMIADPINESPEGSRAGIFGGRDGVFG